MLKKLIKYDVNWLNKQLISGFIATISLAIIVRLLALIPKSMIVSFLLMLCTNALICCIFASIMNVFLQSWARFTRNLYSDQSYLTHTLPVSRSELYNSKIIAAVIAIILTAIIGVIAYLIYGLNKDLINNINAFFSIKGNILLIILLIITVALQIFYLLLSGINGIVFGYKSNSKKSTKAVIFTVIIYFFFQLLNIGIIYIIGLFKENIGVIFKSEITAFVDIKPIVYIVLFNYIIFDLILYFNGRKMFNKGVNID